MIQTRIRSISRSFLLNVSRFRSGPLSGYRVLEISGLGASPFACMMLSDMGAEVIRVERTEESDMMKMNQSQNDFLVRGRKSIALDLKKPEGKATLLRMIRSSDVLVEGFRPGVMERLGLGPDDCMKVNPKLIYGRMTGWGQTGPWNQRAGHDINYISLSGSLAHMIRSPEDEMNRSTPTPSSDITPPSSSPSPSPPSSLSENNNNNNNNNNNHHPPPLPLPPLNLLGDFGGGAMYLAFGIVSALLETHATPPHRYSASILTSESDSDSGSGSGKGQVVDAAMLDGSASLMTMFWGFSQPSPAALASASLTNKSLPPSSVLHDPNHPGTNLLDMGAHFYNVYACKPSSTPSPSTLHSKNPSTKNKSSSSTFSSFISVGAIEPQFYKELITKLVCCGGIFQVLPKDVIISQIKSSPSTTTTTTTSNTSPSLFLLSPSFPSFSSSNSSGSATKNENSCSSSSSSSSSFSSSSCDSNNSSSPSSDIPTQQIIVYLLTSPHSIFSLRNQMKKSLWPELRTHFSTIFLSKTKEEWSEIFEGSDACVTPVLTMSDSLLHPHNKERQVFIPVIESNPPPSTSLSTSSESSSSSSDSTKHTSPSPSLTHLRYQPAPAPRFSRTPPSLHPTPPPYPGQHSKNILLEFGWTEDEINHLFDSGIVK